MLVSFIFTTITLVLVIINNQLPGAHKVMVALSSSSMSISRPSGGAFRRRCSADRVATGAQRQSSPLTTTHTHAQCVRRYAGDRPPVNMSRSGGIRDTGMDRCPGQYFSGNEILVILQL